MKIEVAFPELFKKMDFFPCLIKPETFSYFAFAQGNPVIKSHLNKQYEHNVIRISVPSLSHSFGYQRVTKQAIIQDDNSYVDLKMQQGHG